MLKIVHLCRINVYILTDGYKISSAGVSCLYTNLKSRARKTHILKNDTWYIK